MPVTTLVFVIPLLLSTAFCDRNERRLLVHRTTANVDWNFAVAFRWCTDLRYERVRDLVVCPCRAYHLRLCSWTSFRYRFRLCDCNKDGGWCSDAECWQRIAITTFRRSHRYLQNVRSHEVCHHCDCIYSARSIDFACTTSKMSLFVSNDGYTIVQLINGASFHKQCAIYQNEMQSIMVGCAQ